MNIPMSLPDINERDIHLVSEVLRSGRLSLGPMQEEFEKRFAEFTGARHAVATASGTAGLHMALLALDIHHADVVVTTPFSFVASVNAIIYTGALPLFVDVEEHSGNIDVAAVEALVKSLGSGAPLPDSSERAFSRDGRDKGPISCALPVHVFGQPANVQALVDMGREHGFCVVEDACEALGAYEGESAVGTLGDAGVFAFYPNKQLTTGEGGMVVTNDDAIADVCRSLRNQGRDTFDKWLNHSRLGFNYRMDELSAALGVGQMERIDHLLSARTKVADRYNEKLQGTEKFSVIGLTKEPGRSRSWFVYVIQLDDDVDRDALMTHLEDAGIPSRPYFTPLHTQTHLVERYGYVEEDFPVAARLGRTCLALPFSGVMSPDEVDYVARHLIRSLEKV